MAEINTGGGGGHKDGKVRTKKVSTRVDLTPMVDLGFLLITFFMLATTLIKPQTMEINLPRNDKIKKEDQTLVKASKSITIILAKNNKIFYFFGDGKKDPVTNGPTQVVTADYSAGPTGIRHMLLDRNKVVVDQMKALKKLKAKDKNMSEEAFKKQATTIRSGDAAAIVMITSTDQAKYNNLVNILDEMSICNVSKYAIIDISHDHKALIAPYDK